MKKYKVNFKGFMYIEANNEGEARELCIRDESYTYKEQHIDSLEEVDEFERSM